MAYQGMPGLYDQLLLQLLQQGMAGGGGLGGLGMAGQGMGGQAGIARGMSPTRGIPGALGVSPFIGPPQQGGYQMQNRPRQGGYNVSPGMGAPRQEGYQSTPLTWFGQRFEGPQKQGPGVPRKQGYQSTPLTHFRNRPEGPTRGIPGDGRIGINPFIPGGSFEPDVWQGNPDEYPRYGEALDFFGREMQGRRMSPWGSLGGI